MIKASPGAPPSMIRALGIFLDSVLWLDHPGGHGVHSTLFLASPTHNPLLPFLVYALTTHADVCSPAF